jgi:hypothetical protein
VPNRAAVCLAFLLLSAAARAEGYRTSVGTGDAAIPVVVVRGTPFEMGYALGKLTAEETRKLVVGFLKLAQADGSERYSDKALDDAGASVGPHTSQRFKDEMRGLAEGTGLPFESVRRAYMVPVVGNYSCSALAAWGTATKDGHLYQTRNLDWMLAARAHDTPSLVVYLPNDGIPHLNVTFAGYAGVNTGMNALGIVLSEMGDSPGREYPYDLDGAHFTTMFRDILYQCDTLEKAVSFIKATKRIKKYHYVVGDGKAPRAVKIKAHAPDLVVWSDNDPHDELAPNVLPSVLYQDEGRGAFGPLKADHGQIDAETMRRTACAIPIKGGNVLDVVYDATALEVWVSYARGETEAYLRPFVHVKLSDYLRYDPKAAGAVATWPAVE